MREAGASLQPPPRPCSCHSLEVGSTQDLEAEDPQLCGCQVCDFGAHAPYPAFISLSTSCVLVSAFNREHMVLLGV